MKLPILSTKGKSGDKQHIYVPAYRENIHTCRLTDPEAIAMARVAKAWRRICGKLTFVHLMRAPHLHSTIAKGARDERMIISKVKHDQQKQKALQAIPLKEAVYVGPKEHSSAEYTSNDDFDSNEWSEPASVELPEWSKFSVDRRILEPDYKPKLHKPVHPMAWKHDHPSSESEPELPPNVNGPRPIGTKRFATENYGNPTLAQQLAAQSARQASLPNGQRVPSHGFASPTSQFSNMPMPTFATPSIYSPSNTLNTTSFETESALSMSPASLESTLQLAPPVKLRTNYIDYGVPQFRRRYSESRPEGDQSPICMSVFLRLQVCALA